MSEGTTNTTTAATGDAQRSGAGKGGAIVLLAKVYFIVVGFAQQVLLRNVLGLDAFGRLSLALSVSNVVNNVVVTSSVQGTSRLIAAIPEGNSEHDPEKRTLFAVLRLHLLLAVGLGIAFLGIGWAAARFIGNAALLAPLRALSLVVVGYTLYAPVVGALNGLRLFRGQALLDILFATLRTFGLIGGAYLFIHAWKAPGELGAATGFAIAALLVVPVSLVVFNGNKKPFRPPVAAPVVDERQGSTEKAPSPFQAREHTKRLLALAIGQLLSNALMQGDLLLFGRFVRHVPMTADWTPDAWVGVYRACQTFAFLPYQLLLGVAQILFPLLAKAHAEVDRDRVALFTQRGFRITWLVVGLLVSGLVVVRAPLLSLAFGARVGEAGSAALATLLAGQAMFAVFGVSLAVLASLGKEREAAAISGAAFVLLVLATTIAGYSTTSGADALLHHVTLAVAGALFVSFLVVTWKIVETTGTYARVATPLRVVAATACAALAGELLPPMKPLFFLTVGGFTALAVYPSLLFLMGELSPTELRNAANAAKKRAF